MKLREIIQLAAIEDEARIMYRRGSPGADELIGYADYYRGEIIPVDGETYSLGDAARAWRYTPGDPAADLVVWIK